LANFIGVSTTAGDFHVIHIMHIATHGIIGFHYFWGGLLAGTAGGVEEVNEHSLTAVKDVEQVDFSAVTVGSREVNCLRVRTLRFQAKTNGQREEEGNKFFHRQIILMNLDGTKIMILIQKQTILKIPFGNGGNVIV
jgi:hypothetical protein